MNHEESHQQGIFYSILHKILKYVISIHAMLLSLTTDCQKIKTSEVNEHLFGRFWRLENDEIQLDKTAFSLQWKSVFMKMTSL